jgi:hypothetical protein
MAKAGYSTSITKRTPTAFGRCAGPHVGREQKYRISGTRLPRVLWLQDASARPSGAYSHCWISAIDLAVLHPVFRGNF